MRSKAIQTQSLTARLNRKQRDVLVGLLLGDGHLETQNNGRTYRLKIEHSLVQKEYVDWLYQLFQDHARTEPRQKIQLVSGKAYQKYGFSTLSTGSLRFYGQQFYPNGHKRVPKSISRLLTPIGLAVWFMDDGSIKSNHHRARILNTQGFIQEDIERLQKVLTDRFKIITTRRKQKEGEQIYIPSLQVEQFICLIRPYILPSMEYKIRLT